jgi:hypothetical protein
LFRSRQERRTLSPSDRSPQIVAHGIDAALIEPGKPWQNGVTASFNGKSRDATAPAPAAVEALRDNCMAA